jgi:type II secretory pathway component GspD/PulD (secretin)
VQTPDGQTVVIGGLMEDDKSSTVQKIPYLGDIPLLGNLFKRKVKSDGKSELMIFLTPHIVQQQSQLASLSAREQDHSLLIKKSVSEEELDQFLDRLPAKKKK